MIDAKLGGRLGYLLLKGASVPPSKELPAGPAEKVGAAKLEEDFGKEIWKYVQGRVVADFGCGIGDEAVAAAVHGATKVYGLEISEDFIRAAGKAAQTAKVADKCFFEHFPDPAQILGEIGRLLKPGGRLLVNFGPPWNHPYGAHLRYFTRVPWVHLIFTEETILKVRALYRNDGATKFEEVRGGLNRMTVGHFRSLIRADNFETEVFRLQPVRRTSWLVTRNILLEYFTSAVICV